MNIVLTGFMGTGKSAVGRRLAEQLAVPFVDADDALEQKAGHSIRHIFEHQGEAAFRELERRVIAHLSAHDRMVIATGGGALLDPRNVEELKKNGVLVCLTARTRTLLERLQNDPTRPLLDGENMEARIERLMHERRDAYAQCSVQIETDGKSIAQLADEIIQKVKPQWR